MASTGGTNGGKACAGSQHEPPASRIHVTVRSPGSVIGMLRKDHLAQMQRIWGRTDGLSHETQAQEGILDDEIPLGGSASTMGLAVSLYNSMRHVQRADLVVRTLIERGILEGGDRPVLLLVRDNLAGQFAAEKRLLLEYKEKVQEHSKGGQQQPAGPSRTAE